MPGALRIPPPFPVVAPAKTGKTAPAIPHIAISGEVAEQEKPPEPKQVPFWKTKMFQVSALAAVVVLGGGGYFAFKKLTAPPPPPPPVVVKPKPAAPAAAGAKPPASNAKVPDVANKPAQPAPALSETQAAIAHAPVNAINKAKDVVTKRETGGQSRDAVGAITDGDQPAEKAAPKSASTSATIAPGVSATTNEVEAAADTSTAFRTFIANAKISGVFQGTPARVMFNGRLARAGDTVEPTLGITFDGLDPDRKLILFKDKSGAVVTRRY